MSSNNFKTGETIKISRKRNNYDYFPDFDR